jgi:16S rRNA (cytosine1402-N4)-methyltransferase
MTFTHKSVLLKEVIESLNIKPDGVYVDGTLGGAGHASQVCERLGVSGRLIGIDQDADAIAASRERLSAFEGHCEVTVIRDNYRNMRSVLDGLGIAKVDGIYLDLGVSSYQLDTPERGFTYREDAPLDMRMDDRNPMTAADIVNTYSLHDLARIIREYGEDRFAQNIAKHICAEREKAPIETTGRLAQIVSESIPMKIRATGGNPAKRTFQAIRIELNAELDVLKESLDGMIDSLKPGGRLAVITFHSLEDRIVKEAFKTAANPCICPRNFPVCTCGRVSKGRVVTAKPVVPSEEELKDNPRSASAKLRVFERSC